MPIYMDRHDVSENVTAHTVAELHQKDLKIQHLFNCRGLTYWFDDQRKTAFCLIEAPNEQSLIDMHNMAHGEVPHRIIEVDPSIVESFLGRIEDPKKSLNTDLNIINDPAFRTIMVTGIKNSVLNIDHKSGKEVLLTKYNKYIDETIKQYKGRLVKQNNDYFMVAFESVSFAINCALAVQNNFKNWKDELKTENISLKTGLSAGVPVTDKESIFEDTIKVAERLYYISKAKIIITSEVEDLYKSENLNVFENGEEVQSVTPDDERFLNLLMDFTEANWQDGGLQVDDLGKNLGYSKSQLYRKIISLTGKSPNTFLKDYRLNRALELFRKRDKNVSEVAYETGFNSSSYFAKCFQRKFGLKPSDYMESFHI